MGLELIAGGWGLRISNATQTNKRLLPAWRLLRCLLGSCYASLLILILPQLLYPCAHLHPSTAGLGFTPKP